MATNNNIVAKKTRGRQKIEMTKIKKDTDMIITFSKRKSGIYKKVNELITLTGNEVAFLVFSPAGKPFTFGHPSFKDLALQYLGQYKQPKLSPYNGEMFRQARIQELNHTHNTLLESVKEAHKKEIALRQTLKERPLNNWWNKVVDKVEVDELSDMQFAYSEILTKVEKMRMEMVSLGYHTNRFNININDYVDNSSSTFLVDPYHHHLMNMGLITSSSAQMVDQRMNMTQTTITTVPNYPMLGQLDGGIEFALDHPSSSFGVPHDVFSSDPKQF